jgi:ABC-type nickel/cobalt efflux system permease component RcnA
MILGLALWMAWRTHRNIKAGARHEHEHEHEHGHRHSHETGSTGYQDAHELAHATDIRQRFAGRTVTYSQIALFGLTGGLLPCPAAFTIVLVCLQLKRFALGIFMVLSFSAGLALTLVATGALAAWSLRHAEKRFGGLGSVARKLPYFSSGILTLMALFIGIQGWLHLTRLH